MLTEIKRWVRQSYAAYYAWDRWMNFRRYLWRRCAVRLPPVDGWKDLVREVSSVDLWQKDGLFGLPLEWTLLTRDAFGVHAVETICAWSGVPVSGVTLLMGDPENPTHDLSRWGVRCARCGVPLHCREAGMRGSTDVPSCVPCRPAVRRVIQGG